jgi:hypothetical protein
MKMKRLLFAVMLLAAPLLGQQPEYVQKLVQLKYADPMAVSRLIRIFGAEFTLDPEMKVIGLKGTRDQVTAAEAGIKQLDVPTKNVELTVYFVTGSDKPGALGGNPIPPDLQSVIAQLKTTFTFKNYALLDVLTLRTRTNSRAETSGVLDASLTPRVTTFNIGSITIGEDGTLRIERMHAGVRIPITTDKPNYLDTGITQNIDIKEGQKIVVGRSSLAGPDTALFLILTARVIP